MAAPIHLDPGVEEGADPGAEATLVPAEAREEAEEAAESLPSGTTGSSTGSGIRGGLPRVAEAGVAGALMLFRERVPVRDSCVVRSLIPWPISSRQPKLRGLL